MTGVLFFVPKAPEEARPVFLTGVRFIKPEALEGARPVFLMGIMFVKLEALKEARLVFLTGVTLTEGALSPFALKTKAMTFLLNFFVRFSGESEASEDLESDVLTCFFLEKLWNSVWT